MITNKLIAIVMAFMVTLSFSSCEDWIDVNENPNSPTKVPTKSLVPAAQVRFTTLVGGSMNRRGMFWTQAIAPSYSQYFKEDRYQFLPTDGDAIWGDFYEGALIDIETVIKNGEAEERPNYVAMGKILKAHVFSVITDSWGDIPFSDAVKGGEVLAPTYDAQETIYPAIIALLDEGLSGLQEGGETFGSSDLYYGGDIELWRKYANSLKLRLYMRMTEVNEATAKQGLSAIINSPMISSNEESLKLDYSSSPTNENPLWGWHASGSRRGDFSASTTIVNLLNSLNDPRLTAYFQPNTEDGFTEIKGTPNGNDVLYPDGYSIMNSKLIDDPTAPVYLLTYAEVEFLKAEAAQRFGIGTDAQAHYENGVRAAFAQYDVSGSDDYLSSSANFASASDKLTAIYQQKYLALFNQGVELWAEWRRTGYPNITPVSNGFIGGIPLRYPYPQSELDRNPTNVPNIADVLTPVWWDK
ncbi:SusD/RagB family nutrient-binding outer membrane lipoprotein [Bernardetia sp. Wsw4-3y2]|uniref:SusD/RagB family nutrient-binding outer membrane lipoprotein n=1 Tax=unclassified Bernardetia TaxID=2647129 RepID=UPI0030CE9422